MGGDGVIVEGGEASIKNDEEIRIVLLGRTGSGKSSSGNTILGYEAFEFKMSPKSVTDRCENASGLVACKNISVVDTPGLFDTRFNEDESIKKISGCIHLSAPGPHAFLLVIKLDRFTEEEQRSVEIIQKVFGQESDKYTMVLFTNGDQLEGTVEAFLQDCPKLEELVSKCKGGYHVFKNKIKDDTQVDASQVDELLIKINQMLRENGGSHYTNKMFQEAARKIKEEEERELREMEEKRRAEVEKEAKEKLKKVIIAGATTVTTATAGVAVGATVGAVVFEAALVGGAIGGPIGLAVGIPLGLGILGITTAIKKWKQKRQNRNTPEDQQSLTNNEQPTPGVELTD